MGDSTNVNDLLDDHVVLDLECLDRIYLNVYVPKLQMPGQVIYFLHDHRKMPIASPAILGGRWLSATVSPPSLGHSKVAPHSVSVRFRDALAIEPRLFQLFKICQG